MRRRTSRSPRWCAGSTKLLDVVARDPDISGYGPNLGGNRPVNNGFVVIGLKPRSERSASADQIITRLRAQLAKVPGATLFMQAAQDLSMGGRTTRTQYQYTLQDSNINELNEWAPQPAGTAAEAADAARCRLGSADQRAACCR